MYVFLSPVVGVLFTNTGLTVAILIVISLGLDYEGDF